jgi:hypothetical protein
MIVLLFAYYPSMLIYPSLVNKATGHVHEYSCSPVYTTINGIKTWVSDGYTATTREEIVKLALMNTFIKRQVVGLAQRMAV